MRVTIAQLDPLVGDIGGNRAKLERTLAACAKDSPDLVVFPELFLVGYPPKDLLERAWFIAQVQDALRALQTVSESYPGVGVLLGTPLPSRRQRALQLRCAILSGQSAGHPSQVTSPHL